MTNLCIQSSQFIMNVSMWQCLPQHKVKVLKNFIFKFNIYSHIFILNIYSGTGLCLRGNFESLSKM